jgi:hypothetical protein
MTSDKDTSVLQITPQFRVQDFTNGCCYEFDPSGLRQTNRLLEVQRLGMIYVKVPSERGRKIHLDYTYHYRRTENEIRPPEGLEKSEMMDAALAQFPEFETAMRGSGNWSVSIRPEKLRIHVHWLLLLQINFNRLRTIAYVRIPEARFVFLRLATQSRKWPFGELKPTYHLRPAVIQEAIDGITLWMVREVIDAGGNEFSQHIPDISRQLGPIQSLKARDYFDWNLRNFVYVPKTRVLWYVDPKPTVFIGKHMNDINLEALLRYFPR